MAFVHTLAQHLPGYDSAQVARVRVGDLLLHQAGLAAWRPFYMATLESLKPGLAPTQRAPSEDYTIAMGSRRYMNRYALPSPRYYQPFRSAQYPIPVARGLYGRAGMRDTILAAIACAPLSRKVNAYLYSDWSFILLQQLLEGVYHRGLDTLAAVQLYEPLGMGSTAFNPWALGWAARCAPTEYDLFFRKALVQGYAHDMAAAMMGGVAGHAGLFSTANDVAILGAMLANGGEYGGRRYFDSATVVLFTSSPDTLKGYRGYGFDKINPKRRQANYIGESMPPASYGHIGFTGTILWIDPKTRFVFVLLSNRTFPDSNNLKINLLRVRAQIMHHLYQSVLPTESRSSAASQ